MSEYILEVKNLSKKYKRNIYAGKKAEFTALDNIEFRMKQNTTLGILGESGCGKTTLARCIMGAVEMTSGEVYCRGNFVDYHDKKQRKLWKRQIQLVYQDSFSAFDSKKTIQFSLEEALQVAGITNKKEKAKKIDDILRAVNLDSEVLKKYSFEVSGGQCQRLNIARALLLEPEILILDEPTSAIDTSLQKQVLELLDKLKKERNLSYIFISHDLPAVYHISDEILVMYKGKIVETGSASKIFHHPEHEYTKLLIESVYNTNVKEEVKTDGDESC